MKNMNRFLQVIPATLLVVACANKKDPVADLPELREKSAQSEARAKMPVEPLKPQIVNVPVMVDKPVIRDREVIKYVDKIDGSYLKITPPTSVTFTEGATGSFTVKVRCTLENCAPSLTAEDLPEGATFTKQASNEPSSALYKFTYTPKIGITDASTGLFGSQSVFKATASVKDASLNETLKSFNVSQVVSYTVTRAPIAVKEVAIVGLPAEIAEGKQADFAVTAKITGIDAQGAAKPTLTRSDDISTATAGGPVEIGGAGFVPRYQSAEYKGNSVWEFKMKFDAKNFVVPKTGEGDVARAGLGFQVCMSGVCSDVKTTKINIKFAKPVKPTVATATVGKK